MRENATKGFLAEETTRIERVYDDPAWSDFNANEKCSLFFSLAA